MVVLAWLVRRTCYLSSTAFYQNDCCLDLARVAIPRFRARSLSQHPRSSLQCVRYARRSFATSRNQVARLRSLTKQPTVETSIEMDRADGNDNGAHPTSAFTHGSTTPNLAVPAKPDAESLASPESTPRKRIRHSIENPFKLRSSVPSRTDELAEVLKQQATELHIECKDLQNVDIFSRSMFFAVIFTAGKAKDEWEEWDRTEIVHDSASPRFVKAVRLPSANELDRTTVYQLRLYRCRSNAEEQAVPAAFAESYFTISEIIEDTSLCLRIPVKSPRSGRKKGEAVLSLDLIQNGNSNETVVLDFGFTEAAPLSNQFCFVVTRALRKGRFAPIYRSEFQSKEVLSKFEDACLIAQRLHGGDESRYFRLEVHQYHRKGKTSLLGYVQTSLERLKRMEPGSALYWWPALNGLSFAHVKVISTKLESERCWFVIRMTGG